MRRSILAVAMLAGLSTLTACDVLMPNGHDEAKLAALGFHVTARDASGSAVAMSYSGPATMAVLCGPAAGPFLPAKASMTDLDGKTKRATLDAYMILSAGRVKSGVYALTLRGPGRTITATDFHSGESGQFPSGLTCKGA